MIIFDKEATHSLERLPEGIRERIYRKIVSAESNPFHFFERLKGRKDYRLRVGDYRVIADIDEDCIRITVIGHRREVYEK